MIRRPALVTLALMAAPLTVLPVTRVAASQDPSATATAHLRADAVGRLTLRDGTDGRLRYVGIGAHGVIDNPDVNSSDSVPAAARAHLDRYAAALGAARGTGYVQRSTAHSVAGTDVVRYDQQVDGVPVFGGQVVLALGKNHELRSLAADVAATASVTDASVSAADAARTARAVVGRQHRGSTLRVTDLGRWVFDPAVAGLDLPFGTRTVRRLEVGDGAGIRDLVLVDDHTGQVLFRTSLIENESINRVVCDDANIPVSSAPCTSNFARAEGDAAVAVTDVNQAYDFAQEVSTFYDTISNHAINITDLLGLGSPGSKQLAATVRFCDNQGDPCPYANAFWDGTQMYYGQGYAAADDVVGHEMTHGVVDQFSKLFYWGQSGAINESLADIMGEFIDHRNGTDDDSAWNLGEDLPGGALRNMKDPTLFGQPDRMTSANYTADDVSYNDSAGVHTNSGVGNKTAYLISQGTGGTAFNGQTFTGIDGSDTTLTKTAKLYLDVIEKLPSGADYADLASQLDQSCNDLVAAGTAGFTSADCTVVHQAGLATELRTNPPNAAHATDASTTCPTGTTKRVLLNGETNPTAKFAPFHNTDGATAWSRATSAGLTNATSGRESWYGPDPGIVETNALRAVAPVKIPAGQQSYLSFQNWYVFDYGSDPLGGTPYFDGGTVEVGVDGATPALGSTDGSAWVNGPNAILNPNYGNTGQGHPAFGADSHGWAISRLDLSNHAGHQVQPQFTMRSDNGFSFIGWYLDDIQIYTCDKMPSAARSVASHGAALSTATQPLGQVVTWSAPSTNPGSVGGYRLYVDGVLARSGNASFRSAVVRNLSRTRAHTFTVRVVNLSGQLGPSAVTRTSPTTLSLTATRRGGKVRLSGVLRRGGRAFGGQRVRVERKVGAGWVFVGVPVPVSATGTYAVTVSRSTAATYRVVFAGASRATGTYSPLRTR